MANLVVYYSRTGNTKKIGEAVAKALNCDKEELIDTKDRLGALGYVSGGYDASRKNLTILKDLQKNLMDYDLVIVGTPIWAWNVCPAVRTFLLNNKEKIKNLAFFATEGGSGDEKAFAEMESISGKRPVAILALRTKEVVKGEYSEKIDKFVKEIKK
jgi:flavodoxin